MKHNLIIIVGQEGSGKSTIARALLPYTPNCAEIDAEDVGQTNPWEMNDSFVELLWKNVLCLIKNFWEAGYSNIIAGSFIGSHEAYKKFRSCLSKNINVYVVQLCASKSVRDKRRINRSKPTKKEWREFNDINYPEDKSFQAVKDDYHYIRIENDDLTIKQTVVAIKKAIPEIYLD